MSSSNEIEFGGYRFPRNKAVLVCDHVFSRERTIRVIAHEPDGWLQALCGADDYEPIEAKVVGLGEVIARLPSPSLLPRLGPGEAAEQGSDGSWHVASIE